MNKEDTKIDLSSIDWNVLSIEEFSAIEQSLIRERKVLRKEKKRTNKSQPNQVVKFNGVYYSLEYKDFARLKSFKAEKSKQKFIQELMLKYQPVEML